MKTLVKDFYQAFVLTEAPPMLKIADAAYEVKKAAKEVERIRRELEHLRWMAERTRWWRPRTNLARCPQGGGANELSNRDALTVGGGR